MYGNNYQYSYAQQQEEYRRLFIAEQNEKREIKFFGRVAGACVIGYVIVQQLLGFLLYIEPVYNAYESSKGFQSVYGMLFSLLGVLVPFLIGAAVLRKRTGADPLIFSRPKRVSSMLLFVPVGFLACLAANFIANYFITFMESWGFVLTGVYYDAPSAPVERIFYYLHIAVVPALCEELAVRGVVMQPLRKYGDRFAIIASSVVFALMHGNLIQAPFALIAGAVIGYAVCATGSIWTGILIHFVNNSFSVFVEFLLADVADPARQNLIYYGIMIAAAVLGILCAAALVLMDGKSLRVTKRLGILTSGQKGKAYVLNAAMIVALLIMIVMTSMNVEWQGF